jgi:hypothetical protein
MCVRCSCSVTITKACCTGKCWSAKEPLRRGPLALHDLRWSRAVVAIYGRYRYATVRWSSTTVGSRWAASWLRVSSRWKSISLPRMCQRHRLPRLARVEHRQPLPVREPLQRREIGELRGQLRLIEWDRLTRALGADLPWPFPVARPLRRCQLRERPALLRLHLSQRASLCEAAQRELLSRCQPVWRRRAASVAASRGCSLLVACCLAGARTGVQLNWQKKGCGAARGSFQHGSGALLMTSHMQAMRGRNVLERNRPNSAVACAAASCISARHGGGAASCQRRRCRCGLA